MKEWRDKNKKGITEYRKDYYQNHQEEEKERAKNYGRRYRREHAKKIFESRKRYNLKHKEKVRQRNRRWQRQRTLQLKNEIHLLLGNKCSSCGYDKDFRAFEIDHVLSDGYKEPRESRIEYLKRILEEIKGGSKKYQLLCANCNRIKQFKNDEWRASNP